MNDAGNLPKGCEAANAHLSQEIPAVLWHYTSFTALQGIVTSKAIWASEYRFLNDVEEFLHAKKLAESVIEEEPPGAIAGLPHEIMLDKLVKSVFNSESYTPERLRIMVASFSAVKDQLSQWRGYAGDSTGVSLGLDLRHLRAHAGIATTVTYHHWSVFAHGSSGVCVSFKKEPLLDIFREYRDIRVGKVSYLPLTSLKGREGAVKDLPFMKRAPYAPEGEFRAIYEDSEDLLPYLNIKIGLACIDRVTLSPWMPKNIADSVKRTIRRVPGARELDVTRSTLVQNDSWAKFSRVVAGEKETKKRELATPKHKRS